MPIYHSIIRPLLFKMPTETAHEVGIETLKIVLGSKFSQNLATKHFETQKLEALERFGLSFRNPLGVAAGFDKNGVVVNQLSALGFGFVEVGTVTFEPQKGNEKPRLFRLPEDKALINRLGFNNEGTPKVVERLKKTHRECVLGVNIGKNKEVALEDATENYLKSFELAYDVADYIAVNVSSPNTPNLRELQKAENLEELLNALQNRNREKSNAAVSAVASKASRDAAAPLKPLLIKIAPDLSYGETEQIVDICLRLEIAGIIATNTTVRRENLETGSTTLDKIGDGGLSGKPLATMSNYVISNLYTLSKGKLPVIGVGGIFTAEDAFEKIAAGACLLQAYTGFIYYGPSFARDINFGLSDILKAKGFGDINSAIGSSLVKTNHEATG
ncbi:MAG: quinone-dependent dihydroorotate dehydrogenase [Pyrinomonadaceae bacterium]